MRVFCILRTYKTYPYIPDISGHTRITYLEEDNEAGDPEAGKEGVVEDVEHCDLQPGEGSSAILGGLTNVSFL